jgi:hypothetical protein
MEVRTAGPAPPRVKAQFVEFVERTLHVGGAGALKHDVAGLAVEGDQARAVLFPDVAHLAQNVGVVVHAGRRLHPQGVKFLGGRKHLGHFGEARDHAATVAEDPDRATLPVALAGLVGVLELTHQVGHVVVVLGQPLQASDKTGPRTALQLVKHRGIVLFLAHEVSPVRRQPGAGRSVNGLADARFFRQVYCQHWSEYYGWAGVLRYHPR